MFHRLKLFIISLCFCSTICGARPIYVAPEPKLILIPANTDPVASGEYVYFGSKKKLWKVKPGVDPVSLPNDFGVKEDYDSPQPMIDFNGRIVFTTSLGIYDWVWISDGTETGTSVLTDSGKIQGMGDFAVGENCFFFTALTLDAMPWDELWVSDGTARGTRRVKSIAPHENTPTIRYLCVVGNDVFFARRNADTGWELWRSNGTDEGTLLVKDIVPGSASSDPRLSVALNGNLFFVASTAAGVQLWRSDGSDAGTSAVTPTITAIESTIAIDSHIVFTGRTSTHDLYRSDGTLSGLAKVLSLPWSTTYSDKLAFGHGKVYLGADTDLYGTDGFSWGWHSSGILPYVHLTPMPSGVFFANTEIGYCSKDNRFFKSYDVMPGAGGSYPRKLTALGSTVYFTASGPSGFGLYSIEEPVETAARGWENYR